MSRSTLLVLGAVLFSAGCNRPDIRERESVAPSTYETGQEGAWLGGAVGKIEVDAASREAMGSWEVGSTARFTYQEGDAPVGELTISKGALEEVASDALSDGYASTEWTDAPFGECTENGFYETDDGGCGLDVQLLVGVDRSAVFQVDVVIRGWLPEGESADTDSMALSVALEPLEPEDDTAR